MHKQHRPRLGCKQIPACARMGCLTRQRYLTVSVRFDIGEGSCACFDTWGGGCFDRSRRSAPRWVICRPCVPRFGFLKPRKQVVVAIGDQMVVVPMVNWGVRALIWSKGQELVDLSISNLSICQRRSGVMLPLHELQIWHISMTDLGTTGDDLSTRQLLSGSITRHTGTCVLLAYWGHQSWHAWSVPVAWRVWGSDMVRCVSESPCTMVRYLFSSMAAWNMFRLRLVQRGATGIGGI